MQLTNEILARYIGGQIEIQNQVYYLYRGEIKTITLDAHNDLEITLNWMAKGDGYPPIPKQWIADNRLTHKVSLDVCSVSDIGPSSEGGDNRICIMSPLDEITILFPANGSKLDYSRVRGNLQSPVPDKDDSTIGAFFDGKT